MQETRTPILFADPDASTERLAALSETLRLTPCDDPAMLAGEPLCLHLRENGLALEGNGQSMECDFSNLLRRLRRSNLSQELLVRASRIRHTDRRLTVIDATAGLGEDSFLLAAAGFSVRLYERNPYIAALLQDALSHAAADPGLSEIVGRMELFAQDSILALPALPERPDVVFLDPMFPEKEKSALAKKKFQLLHLLEEPCADEQILLQAALDAKPLRIVIKRPLKGPFLAGKKPSFSLKGKAIRYDVLLLAD